MAIFFTLGGHGCHVFVRVTVQVHFNLLKFSVLFSKTEQMTNTVIKGHKF